MSSIKLKHSGGNGVSIAPPDTNPASDKTVKLPATNGTLLTTGSSPSFRNLIINGAMQVAQRGTSSTSAGYTTIDRMQGSFSNTDEAPTFSQADVASGTTPYQKGFRKSYKITNGNQTSGAGTSDYIYVRYKMEAQDIANSGWNYLSASSYITVSYWVKSSVAQNFYGLLQTHDGTGQGYVWETGSLSADTWTKITKTIPGNSNLQFDNNNENGLEISPIRAFDGTDRTASMSLNTWGTYSSSSRTPDQTSTWYTTNDATLEITGLQLEVGEVATDFEHRSYGDELFRCQRYYEQFNSEGQAEAMFSAGYFESETVHKSLLTYVDKRAAPTITFSAANSFSVINTGAMPAGSSIGTIKLMKKAASLTITLSSSISGSDGNAGVLSQVGGGSGTPEATIKVSAEL